MRPTQDEIDRLIVFHRKIRGGVVGEVLSIRGGVVGEVFSIRGGVVGEVLSIRGG